MKLSRIARGFVPIVLSLVLALIPPPGPASCPASGLAFGQGPVRSPAEPPWIPIHRGTAAEFFAAPGSDAAAVSRGIDFAALDRVAGSTLPRLAAALGLPPGGTLRVDLVPVEGIERGGEFTPVVPPWAAGVAFAGRQEVLLVVGRHAYPDQDLAGVLAHECAHVALGRALLRSGVKAPRWFEEGFAVHEARPWGWQDAVALATAFIPQSPPPLSTYAEGFPDDEAGAREAYVVSVAFIEYLVRRSDPDAPLRIARRMSDGMTFDAAISKETGSNMAALEADWISGAEMRYRWIPILTSSGAIWTVVMALLFVAGMRRRKRRLELEEIWARSEPSELN
jgi:hypothetical protein